MAVNGGECAVIRSAEKEINYIISVMNMDKRTEKKWQENVLKSAQVIKEALLQIKNMIDLNKNVVASSVQEHSYSSVTQNITKTECTKNVVIISPKCPETVVDSEQTLKLVQATTKHKLNVGVIATRKIRNKRVLIELRSAAECVSFQEKIQQCNDNLVINIPRKHNPRIIVHGIDANFPEDELLSAIKEQNPNVAQCLLDTNQSMTKRFMKKAWNGQTQFAVLEVSPMIYRTIMRSAKLFIGYSRCKVNDHFHVIRCHKCSAFGHIAADCRSQLHCPQCSEQHELKDCRNTKTECINCKTYNSRMATRNNFRPYDIDHPATSSDCPAFKKTLNIIKSKINYD